MPPPHESVTQETGAQRARRERREKELIQLRDHPVNSNYTRSQGTVAVEAPLDSIPVNTAGDQPRQYERKENLVRTNESASETLARLGVLSREE